MRIAVLKNRLLQITSGAFDQSRYGAGPFSTILALLPDLVALSSDQAGLVELVARDRVESRAPAFETSPPIRTQAHVDPLNQSERWRNVRIRDDLWNAILHWENAEQYVWDVEAEVARPVQLTDSDSMKLPTLSRDAVQGWRNDFVYQRSSSESPQVRTALQSWADGPGAASALPKAYRGLWMEYLKSHVYALINDWFNAKALPLPEGLLLRSESRGVSDPTIQSVVKTRRLRSLLVDALEEMTYEEMSELPLPAGILLRLHDRS